MEMDARPGAINDLPYTRLLRFDNRHSLVSILNLLQTNVRNHCCIAPQHPHLHPLTLSHSRDRLRHVHFGMTHVLSGSWSGAVGFCFVPIEEPFVEALALHQCPFGLWLEARHVIGTEKRVGIKVILCNTVQELLR